MSPTSRYMIFDSVLYTMLFLFEKGRGISNISTYVNRASFLHYESKFLIKIILYVCLPRIKEYIQLVTSVYEGIVGV